jgi:hypothetical protein
MAVSRVAAATLAELTTDVRRELGDVATTPAGDTIPAGLLRYSDSEIFRVLNNRLIAIQLRIQARHPGESLVGALLSYTEGTSPDIGANLPTGVDANGVFKVEDMSPSSGIPEPVTPVSLHEIERYANTLTPSAVSLTPYWYTLVDRGTSHAIVIRPQPSDAHVFRIWYIATPLVYSTTSDAPALGARFRELIALGAAFDLMGSSQDRVSEAQVVRLQLAEQNFNTWMSRNKGPQRIRKVERGAY